MTVTQIRHRDRSTRHAEPTAESRQLAELETRIAECRTAIEQHPEWSDIARQHLAEYETRRAELVALTATAALAA